MSRIRLISSSEVKKKAEKKTKKKKKTAYSMSSEATNEILIVFCCCFFLFIFRDVTKFVLTIKIEPLFLFVIYYSLEKEMQILLSVRESPMRSFVPLTMKYQTV